MACERQDHDSASLIGHGYLPQSSVCRSIVEKSPLLSLGAVGGQPLAELQDPISPSLHHAVRRILHIV